MSNVTFKRSSKGVRQLLKNKDMQGMLLSRANEIANRAGSGYEADIYVGKNRANASIWAATKEARNDNYDNNTLLKSVR